MLDAPRLPARVRCGPSIKAGSQDPPPTIWRLICVEPDKSFFPRAISGIVAPEGQFKPTHRREGTMGLRQILLSTVAALAIAGMAIAVPAPAGAQQAAGAIDGDDIGGVVTGSGGPEAGVWVIAETTDLPTKFAKIVVTDDQGRYLVQAPTAPNAAAAAQYYPPIYWFSMMHVPAPGEFPMPKIKSQGEWLNIIKSGACQPCQ